MIIKDLDRMDIWHQYKELERKVSNLANIVQNPVEITAEEIINHCNEAEKVANSVKESIANINNKFRDIIYDDGFEDIEEKLIKLGVPESFILNIDKASVLAMREFSRQMTPSEVDRINKLSDDELSIYKDKLKDRYYDELEKKCGEISIEFVDNIK